MVFKINGCYGNSKKHYETTYYLINRILLLDDGAATEYLDYATTKLRKNELEKYTGINGIHIEPILPIHIVYTVCYGTKKGGKGLLFGHMTLSMLLEHLDKDDFSKIPVHINHIKPIFNDEILGELSSPKRGNIKSLQQSDQIML